VNQHVCLGHACPRDCDLCEDGSINQDFQENTLDATESELLEGDAFENENIFNQDFLAQAAGL